MKTIVITNEQRRTYLHSLIDEQPADGSVTVEVKKTDTSPTAAQRRLQWLWATEVSQSGLGQDDTKEAVHVRAKYMFALPILLRDSVTFGAIYSGFSEMVEQIDAPRDQLWREFTRDYVSTEKLSRAQRAEYLTEFQRYWTGRGVVLTDPALQGLDEHLGRAA